MVQFDIDKEAAKVEFILEKRGIPALTAEVVADLDVSGSTEGIYRIGAMQNALQRVVPVALNLDDNGELPVYVFNGGNSYLRLGQTITSKNYAGYIDTQIMQNRFVPKWGSTDYAPVLWQNLTDLGFVRTTRAPDGTRTQRRGLLERLMGGVADSVDRAIRDPQVFRQSSSGLPSVVYFFTDGENADKQWTSDLLAQCSQVGSHVYFNFIGVGNQNFRFLRQMAARYPNTGFAQIVDIERTAGSDDIYEYLVPDQLTEWLRFFVRNQEGARA